METLRNNANAAAGSRGHAGARTSEGGFVLVSVIWIAGLLAVVAIAFTITVRSHTLAGSNAIYNTRAEYVANGMALATALKLASANDARSIFSLSGTPTVCSWSNEVSVSISVQDQGGLVDVNTASPELLAALLEGVGTNENEARDIARALQDFRDPDSISSSGTSEPALFPGKSYGPKNGPLAIREEIDQLPEIKESFFDKLIPFVTVHSQQPGIDLAVTPPALLALLRSNGDTMARFTSPSPGKLFLIDATAGLKNGSRYHRQALVSVLRQPDRPFAILAWQRGNNAADAAPVSAGGLPCIN
jgi:general secretion pathway protein K